MGCESYLVEGLIIKFNEDNDEVGCLCTFPFNDGEHLTPDHVRALALLGAAVVLARRGALFSGGYAWLPDALPSWMWAEIKRIVPDVPDVAVSGLE